MAGIETVNVKATKDLPFSPDGTEVVQKKAGDVFACPADVAVGLKAAGLVEDAGENAEPTPPSPEETKVEAAVISPQTHGMAELQELDDAQRAELLQSRMVQAPVTAQPDIEPVEHGGDSIDRVLTRGVDSDAKLVEDADTVASIGKDAARNEAATAQENEENAPAPTDAPGATEDGKMASAPENKVRRSSKKS